MAKFARPEDIKVIVATDCGSTTTKAILIEYHDGEYRLMTRGEAPTTVEAPFEDVTMGVLNAVAELEELSGRKILDDDGKFISPSNGKTGTVYVRSRGLNQRGEEILRFVRWVMVRKRDATAASPKAHVPALSAVVGIGDLNLAGLKLDMAKWNYAHSGSAHRFGDYAVGEKIDHLDGMTVDAPLGIEEFGHHLHGIAFRLSQVGGRSGNGKDAANDIRVRGLRRRYAPGRQQSGESHG